MIYNKEIKFQFHKGTIKTECCSRCTFCARSFQFHKGTIKTSKETGNRKCKIYNFNSIKVRLKHAVAVADTQNSLFQFHKGTIKTPYYI